MKKIDGSPFPGKTLYDMVLCIQFQLEALGISWKLINDDMFKDLVFTLDNLMKERTAEVVSISVKNAQNLSETNEEYL